MTRMKEYQMYYLSLELANQFPVRGESRDKYLNEFCVDLARALSNWKRGDKYNCMRLGGCPYDLNKSEARDCLARIRQEVNKRRMGK